MNDDVIHPVPRLIFFSRWLQAPLYLGLIAVLAIYVYEFGRWLYELVLNVMTHSFSPTATMLAALDLIDIVMIANLLIMVIIGGYEVFVSRLGLSKHPDHPEWLDEVDANSMKIKLAIALITVSSIHLLRTFMDPTQYTNMTITWQVAIHVTLLISVLVIAITGKISGSKGSGS